MKDNSPLISIIIPVFNREKLVKESLESILTQTYTNWECIVVDDGSTDNTWQFLQEYADRDKRIKIFKRTGKPKGAPSCRNIGLEKANGDYLMFFDSDDFMAKECLQFRADSIIGNEENDALIFETNIFQKTIGDDKRKWNKLITNEDDLIRFLRQDMPWCISDPLWKNTENIITFNENAKSFQDWEYHIRAILENKKYKKIESDNNFNKTYYRKDEVNYTSIGSNSKNKSQLKNRGAVVKEICQYTLGKELSQRQRKEVVKLIIRTSKNLRINGLKKESLNLMYILKEHKLTTRKEYIFWYFFIIGYTKSTYKFVEFLAYKIFKKADILNNNTGFMKE